MKNLTTVTRVAVAACVALVLAFAATAPVSTTPNFTASIFFDAETEVCVGDATIIDVTWTANPDVNRSQWSVNDVTQGGVTNLASGSGGSDSFLFLPTNAGFYDVSFRIWHHQQVDRQDRDAEEGVTLEAVECGDDGCPAAPAIANAYLKERNYKGKRGQEIIMLVAAARNAGLFGEDKCESTYAAGVRSYVDTLLEK